MTVAFTPAGYYGDGSRDELTERKKSAFLEAFRAQGIVYRAAATAGVDRGTIWRWRQDDPEFDRACKAALEDSTDTLETSLYERALTEKGMPGVIAALASLKARRPERWNEKLMVVRPEGDPAVEALKEFTALLREARALRSGLPSPATPAPNELDAQVIDVKAEEVP